MTTGHNVIAGVCLEIDTRQSLLYSTPAALLTPLEWIRLLAATYQKTQELGVKAGYSGGWVMPVWGGEPAIMMRIQ